MYPGIVVAIVALIAAAAPLRASGLFVTTTDFARVADLWGDPLPGNSYVVAIHYH